MLTRSALTSKYSNDLKKWRADITRFLDAQGINTSLLIPVFQRQRNVLNFAYWHAMILTHRPFLLNNFARLQSHGVSYSADSAQRAQSDDSVRECLQAAMNIVDTVDELMHAGQMFRAFWVCLPHMRCSRRAII